MLANQIIILRKASGMSQSQLAQKLNIGSSAVGMYEQGRRTPAVDVLIEMANLFEVSLDYLITGKEAPSERTDKKLLWTNLYVHAGLAASVVKNASDPKHNSYVKELDDWYTLDNLYLRM